MKSLYIHIPFCKHKCFYCDFNSYCGKDDLIDKYIKSLKKELDLIIHKEGFKTIYIGGGTPSYIPSKYIKEILESARCDGEITIEVNPGTVTIEKLFDYKDAGVNRLSIGLQVIQDELLKSIGRIHNLEDFNDTFKMAREVGFKNINVDLMIGLSNQTLNDVKESVNYIINKNPEHISCYSLITHDDLIKKYPNAFKSLPDDELEREMYYYVCNTLKSNGYIQYEISNFCKEGFESKHNLCYWNQEEYYGVGAGASSYIDGIRYKNADEIEKYISMKPRLISLEDDRIEEIQDLDSRLREFIILKLRLIDGVTQDEVLRKFNVDLFGTFAIQIDKLNRLGLIEIFEKNEQKGIKLTSKGLDLANQVWEEFI